MTISEEVLVQAFDTVPLRRSKNNSISFCTETGMTAWLDISPLCGKKQSVVQTLRANYLREKLNL